LIFLIFLLPPSLFSAPLSLSCLSSSPSLLFPKPNPISSSPSLPFPKPKPTSRRLPHSLSRAYNPPIHQRCRTNKDAERRTMPRRTTPQSTTPRRTTPQSTTPPSGLMLDANKRYNY
ncbi:hypothetical protein Tsubulata_050782, partial [Turnera subulata]